MNEQADRIVKKLKDDAKQSRKDFLSEIVDTVGETVSDSFQSQELIKVVDGLKEKCRKLDDIDDMAKKLEALDEMRSALKKIEEIKLTEIEQTEQKIADEVCKINQTIKAEDIVKIQNAIHKQNKSLDAVKASESDVLLAIGDIKKEIKWKDIVSLKDLSVSLKELILALKDTSENLVEGVNQQKQEVDEVRSMGEMLLETVNSENISYIRNNMEQQSKAIENIASHVSGFSDAEDENSIAGQLKNAQKSIHMLYIMNGVSIAGIIIMILLFLVR